MFFRMFRCILGAPFLLFVCILTTQVKADTADRLETAAIKTPFATSALLLDITRAGDRLISVGEQGIILLSDDHGQSWRQADVSVSVMLTAVSFYDVKNGWAVGHDGTVLSTIDSGLSWQLELTARTINQLRVEQLEKHLSWGSEIANQAVNENLKYALDDARYAQQEGATPPLLDVWFRNEREGYIIGAYGLYLRTEDGGKSWQSLGHQLPNPDGFHLNTLLESSQGDLYIAGEAGILMRSKDGGDQWESLDSPYEGSFFALSEFDQLYLMGLRGHLFSSVDGEHWKQEKLTVRSSLNTAVIDDKRMLVLGQGGVVLKRTHDGFIKQDTPLRRTVISGEISGDRLVLVGDGGVKTIALSEEGNDS